MTDSKTIDDGGLAFPSPKDEKAGWSAEYGMSVRALIASKVISGLCANPSIFQANERSGWDLVNCTERDLANCAVRIADEMIASLKAGV